MAVKFKITGEGTNNLINYIEGVSGEPLRETVEEAVKTQFDDGYDFILIPLSFDLRKITGIDRLKLLKTDIKKVEPLDFNNWIPYSRIDEVDVEEVGEGSAVLLAESLDDVLSSNVQRIHVGTFYEGGVEVNQYIRNFDDCFFKFITL